MAIHQLDEATIRVIGASQAVADPASVVKELLDNALDAHATSIGIDISSNTVDVIQIRDNGHGIAPGDRSLVAMPNCTSKIRDDEDISSIGGSSLGFRGQALGSIAELSGSITIMTRVEGEETSTTLKVSQRGEIVGQERASLPVGTTIKILDFMKVNPVRRQLALKNNERCLTKVRQTLHAYAFARPHVRLSFRILKAKNDTGNWMYVPTSKANVEDPAIKIVGNACASQCVHSTIEEHGFKMSVFSPRQDADAEKVSGIGSFISIDGRPMNAGRGTFRQLVKIFREALKATSTKLHGIKEPFLYLEVLCSSFAYDPNIEPAKDDVLFEDPDPIIDAARRLFASIYHVKETTSSLQSPAKKTSDINVVERTVLTSTDNSVTSLNAPGTKSRRSISGGENSCEQPSTTNPAARKGSGKAVGDSEAPVLLQQTFGSNMYDDYDEDVAALGVLSVSERLEAESQELRRARKDVNLSNPWVMAKMNTSLRCELRESVSDEDLANSIVDGLVSKDSLTKHSQRTFAMEEPGLATPRPSSPAPQLQDLHDSGYISDQRPSGHNASINSQVSLLTQTNTRPSLLSDRLKYQNQHKRRQNCPSDHGLSSKAAKPLAGTPKHAIPDAGRRQRRVPNRLRSQTSISNRNVRDFVSSSDAAQGSSLAPSAAARHNERHTRVYMSITPSSSIEEFRSRPSSPRSSHRLLSRGGFLPASELAALETRFGPLRGLTAPPAKRRKTSERCASRRIEWNALTPQVGDGDHENSAVSHTRSDHRRAFNGASKSVARTLSSYLPLEQISPEKKVHNLELPLRKTCLEILLLAGQLDLKISSLKWSDAADRQYSSVSRALDAVDTRTISTKLGDLMADRVSDGEMVQDLHVLVQEALTSHRKEHTNEDFDVGADLIVVS